MDNASYATLTRQAALRREIQTIANNIANASTAGFQREGLIFAEHVADLEDADSDLSMADATARLIDRSQGQLAPTGGAFDFAIQGEGYFLVETPQGRHLTRQGTFQPGPAGELVTPEGHRLLDAGGAPVFVPADARDVHLADDGTLSAGGQPLGQIGLWAPADPTQLSRAGGTRFAVEGEIVPVEGGRVVQGFSESSNVDPILEVARMIEVQRAYEQSGRFLKGEDDRIRSVIDTLGK